MRVEAQRRNANRSGGVPSWVGGLAGGLILGLIIGLTLAWTVFPVEVSNVGPDSLGQTSQANWVQMVADSYALTDDLEQARFRLSPFPEREQQLLLGEAIQEAQSAGDLAREQRLTQMAQSLSIVPAQPLEQPEESGSILNNLLLCVLGVAAVGLLLGLAILVTRMRQAQSPARSRGGSRTRASIGLPEQREGAPSPVMDLAPAEGEDDEADDPFDRLFDEPFEPVAPEPDEPAREVAFADPAPAEVSYSPALDEFVTRYNHGDDGFDMSFSIETAQTEFLGECGVGISDVVNEGSPQQATAFEVWLFDKDDIRTVTKVLLSDYAWQNDELRSRLAPKGELVHIKEGDTIDLETKSLRVRARIREVEYGSGGPGPRAFFDRLVVELTPQQKR